MTPDTSHDASSDSEHNAVDDLAGSAVAATGEVEPEGGDAGPDGLRAAAEKEGPDDGLGAGVEGEVYRKGESKALGDVVDEEGEEDGEAEFGVCVVGGEGYEAFGL